MMLHRIDFRIVVIALLLCNLFLASATYAHPRQESPTDSYFDAASAKIDEVCNRYSSYFGAKFGPVTMVATAGGAYYIQWFTNATALLAWTDGFVYFWDGTSYNYTGASWRDIVNAGYAINAIYTVYFGYFGVKYSDITAEISTTGPYYIQRFVNGTALMAWTDGYIYFWDGTRWQNMWVGWNPSSSSLGLSAPWIAWVNMLKFKGYGVVQGTVDIVDNAACENIISVFGTCFGNNSAAPYIVPQVPVLDTYEDPYYAPSFNTTGTTGALSNMIYRLSDNDALVTMVTLPPKAAYMGYQSYLFSRNATLYLNDNITPGAYTPDPSRAEIFGSFGNAINNVVIMNQSGFQWNGIPVVYITTSNKTLRDTIVADAQAAGLNTNVIFTEPVGVNIVTGHGSSADDFTTLMRYVLYQNAALTDSWKQAIKTNVLVFRVSNPNISVQRYATPVYTTKENSTDESTYSASLTELTSILSKWLEKTMKRPTITQAMLTSDNVTSTGELTGLVGSNCIANGKSCLGDSQDTDAYRLGVIGKLKDNDTAIVTGVNHTLTGGATYISLAIYNMDTFSSVSSASQTNPQAAGFDSGMLTGSAEGVLKALNLYGNASDQLKLQLPMLYTTLIARQCQYTTDYCVSLTDLSALPLSSRVSVTQRAYIKPGSTTGANPNMMLTPQVIVAP